jgi:hypothetical protein
MQTHQRHYHNCMSNGKFINRMDQLSVKEHHQGPEPPHTRHSTPQSLLSKSKEDALNEKERRLKEKEEYLYRKEQSLQKKEQELAALERALQGKIRYPIDVE